MNNVTRILISVICIPVAAFCVFGFLASFEPGVDLGWKIGYALAGLTCLSATVLPWFIPSSR